MLSDNKVSRGIEPPLAKVLNNEISIGARRVVLSTKKSLFIKRTSSEEVLQMGETQ